MVLKEEFREASPYASLLLEASHGLSIMGKIASRAGVPVSHASKYLTTLEHVGLVKRIPILPGGRRNLWITSDRLLRSWFLMPSAGWSPRVLSRIVSMGWEEIAFADAVRRFESRGYRVSRWGRLLSKGVEVDWILLDDERRVGLVVEAKTSIESPEREVRRIEEAAGRLLPGYDLDVLIYSLEDSRGMGPEDLDWPC